MGIVLWSATLLSLADSPSFTREIQPLLASRCFRCHGPDVAEAGLRLDDPQRATEVLESGDRAIVPRDPERSLLLQRVRDPEPESRMPPAESGPPLTDSEIDQLSRWIASGAVHEAHWAYRPLHRPSVPEVRDKHWPRNPIDHFILAKLEASGFRPADEASREVWLRRVSLDLVGLPPCHEDRLAFLADDSPDAYERVVDRLLATPAYGERQASLWLDLARYADSDGYAHDRPRTIWPYRDWVVDAFNADMPFDQFTIEQLAGDLLPHATDQQRIATGFHRNTRINVEAGVDPEEFRIEAAMDRVHTTSAVWLATTMACVQCHTHKFDPFPHTDHYRLLAFFNQDEVETTRDRSGKIDDISPRLAVDWPGLDAPVETLVMRRAISRRDTHIFHRGSFDQPGDRVEAGVPGIWRAIPIKGEDRLALARWLVHPEHPMTARVLVNRLWAERFGTGLVASRDDFGTQTPEPIHRDLLDWLAVEIQQQGWSMKAILRMMVLSATYRQASDSAADSTLLIADPLNTLHGRRSRIRLSAEVLRDQALALGGILSPLRGGPPRASTEMRADGAGLDAYRRSVYVTWRRTGLEDWLLNFDAPTRDVTCPQRLATSTPLQALNLLNDRTMVDAARGLARRLLAESSGTLDDRLAWGIRLCLQREHTEEEIQLLGELHTRRLEAFRQDPEAAKQLVHGGSVVFDGHSGLGDGELDLANVAAWILVANVLLNLEETTTLP